MAESEKSRPRKNDRQEHILEAALQVIARHGMRKTTMEDIAEAAHLRAASIYYYFKSKEEIFSAAVRTIGERFLAQNRSAVEAVDSAKEKLAVYMEQRLVAEAEIGSSFDTTSEVIFEIMPLVHEATADINALDREFIIEILRLGIDDGSFEIDDVERAAITIQASLSGANIICKTGAFDVEIVSETLCKLLIRGFIKHSPNEEEDGGVR